MNKKNHIVHEPTHKGKLIITGAVLLALFLSALDQTVVGTALPKIVTDLGGNSLYVWVITAYLLTSTITVPVYGKLSDLYGRRTMLLIGISIFLFGSALSGLSQNMGELIFFRGLQGIGAGALFPVSLAVIGDLFTPRERGKYQGLFGAVFGLSFLIGPFLGGYITDTIGWHWVFYVNLPIGIVALFAIITLLPNHKVVHKIFIDWFGIITFSIAIVAILIGLTEAGLTNSSGSLNSFLSSIVAGPIVVGFLFLAAFILIELRVKDPLIPLGLFKNITFAFANIAVFFLAFGMFAAIIFLPRYFQAALGISATASGYQIWPMLIGLMGMSIVAGQLISRTGKYKLMLIISAIVFTIGMLLDTSLNIHTNRLLLWLWLGIIGLGLGPSMSAYTLIVQGVMPQNVLGVATSTITFMRQIGGTVGLAIAGTLFANNFINNFTGKLSSLHISPIVTKKIISQANNQLTGVTTTGGKATGFQVELINIAHSAIAYAIGQAFWLGVGAGIVAIIFAVFLPEKPLRGKIHPVEAIGGA